MSAASFDDEEEVREDKTQKFKVDQKYLLIGLTTTPSHACQIISTASLLWFKKLDIE